MKPFAMQTRWTFQIESQPRWPRTEKQPPRKFYDLVTQVALIRPGPIVGNDKSIISGGGMGKEPVTYPHPSLEPCSKELWVCPFFQENY